MNHLSYIIISIVAGVPGGREGGREEGREGGKEGGRERGMDGCRESHISYAHMHTPKALKFCSLFYPKGRLYYYIKTGYSVHARD